MYGDASTVSNCQDVWIGCLEALRRNALEFRNLTHYLPRSLPHCGNVAQLNQCTPIPEEPVIGYLYLCPDWSMQTATHFVG